MKPPKRLFRNRPPRDPGRALISVITYVGMPDEELIVQARTVATHPRIRNALVLMAVDGYDDDGRRGLYEVPEVPPHMRRMVELGLISILTRSAVIPELGGIPGPLGFFGAFEVWAMGEGMMRPGGEHGSGLLRCTNGDIRRFLEVVYPAAAEALRRNLRRFPHVVPDPDLILDALPPGYGRPGR
jgi:hypothetical protein